MHLKMSEKYSMFYFLIFHPKSARAIAPPLCSMAPLDLRPVQYSYEITDTMAKFSKFCTEIMNVFLVILSDWILISFKFQFSVANNSNLPIVY